MTSVVKTLALALVLTVSGSASQQKLDPQQTEEIRQRLQEVKDRLKLTPTQLAKVRPIVTSEMEKVKAAREKNDPQTRSGKIGISRELKQIEGETEKQLKPILSKAQLQEVAKIRAEFRDRIRASRGPAVP
jgi:hypothetical protein